VPKAGQHRRRAVLSHVENT